MSVDKDHLINNSGSELDSGGNIYETYIRPFLAEFVGMKLFVCIACLALYTSGSNVFGVAAAHGLTIAILVVALGGISGAHLNPAVTFAALLTNAISPLKAIFYFGAQILGSLFGAGIVRGILPGHIYASISGGTHLLNSGVSSGQGILCEVVLTLVLVLTILMAAVDPGTKSLFAPLAIGFAVIVDILAGAAVSGASMNPARSFGPAVVYSIHSPDPTNDPWAYHYVFWVGPILGASLAVLWYRFFLASSEKRLILKDELGS